MTHVRTHRARCLLLTLISVQSVLIGAGARSASVPDPVRERTWFSPSRAAGQSAEAWGEPIEGVQLRLTLAVAGPPPLPGELPGFELQIRNQGFSPVTMNPEALIFANVEIDGVWYAQAFGLSARAAPVVIAPASQSALVRTRHNVAVMYEVESRPARTLELRPGLHRIRLRNLAGSLGVHAADGAMLALVSNSIDVHIPERSAAAERDALTAQTVAGGADGIPAAQRLVAHSPDDALRAIEAAIAATKDPVLRSRYVELAGTLPGDRVTSFLLTLIAPGIDLASRMRAAESLLARGRDDGLFALMDTWEQRVDLDRPRTAEDARLLEFLARTGHPHALDLLGRMSALSVEVRFAIVQLFLPPARNGSSRKALDGDRDVNLAMSVYPGDMQVLPGGPAGAAAVERLLRNTLDDREEVPLEGRHGNVNYVRPRVCDMAAFVLSLRWPEKYHFTWSGDAVDRDRQIANIRTTWWRP